MIIDDLLSVAAGQLARAGVAEADLDARLLFQHLTGMNRSQLVLHGRQAVAADLAAQYRQLIDRRSQRVPLHYLTGSREFWSLDFTVSPAVLIPRPETEFLLTRALALVPAKSGCLRVLDLCTGSGVIAVVLAKELGCPVVAVDISPPALAVAAENLRRHQLTDQVTLVGSDLFAGLDPGRRFDLIVSNPPYVADGELEGLEPEVTEAEPRLALSGGASGLEVIARIAVEAEGFLQPGGWILLEIGAGQKASVTALFSAAERHYQGVRVIDDWSGRPRVLQARYLPAGLRAAEDGSAAGEESCQGAGA